MKRSKEKSNQGICSILDHLATAYKSKGDIFRYKAYRVAIDTLSHLDTEITSCSQVQGLKGIGKGMQEKIVEILTTGQLQQWEMAQKDPKLTALTLFTSIHGFGPVAAHEIVYNRNIMTLDDLKKSSFPCNAQQLLGIKYYEDSKEKIPTAEVAYLRSWAEDIIHQTVDPKLIITVCGSHRRGAAMSGDVDVLFTHPASSSDSGSEYTYLHRAATALRVSGFLVDTLSEGETKFMGYCRLPEEGVPENMFPKPYRTRRFDLRFVPYDCYWTALLYFTGSDMFNTEMRIHALSKGFTLNEYGLYKYDAEKQEKVGEKFDVRCEEDIFRLIGYPYCPPTERSK
eukprot:PhF_6_TR43510/c0_g1_i1/m.66793/K02330/POLB; DNA polymerase beta